MTIIEKALADNNIWVVFQPVVDLHSGSIFSYEALVRSSVPDIQDAQTLIDRSVTEKMCGKLGRALRAMASDQCPDTPLFLNIHPKEFDASLAYANFIEFDRRVYGDTLLIFYEKILPK